MNAGDSGSFEEEGSLATGECAGGGSSGCENGDGGGSTVTGFRSGSINAGGVGVADAGGISMTGSS